MFEKWIIPCNISFFNLIKHFEKNKTVVWRNAFTIHKGDIAYIYIGRPYGEIRYKCRVISDQVDEQLLQENTYAIPAKKTNNYFSKKEKYIVMEYICEYPEGTFPLESLRKHGLGQVQIQARADRRLQAYLTEIETQLEKGGDD